MSYLSGADRAQAMFLPETVEQYVPPDSPVRAIDAFVDGLDLRALKFARHTPAATGRPPYHPGDLLKLFLWGYLNRVCSSRKLEVECTRNLELCWLLRLLRPDFKTIADFRRDNAEALKLVFRDFVLLCRELRLIKGELTAIDGSKLKASNHPTRRADAETLTAWLQGIDERIAEYLAALEQSEVETDLLGDELPAAAVPEFTRQLAELRRRKEQYEQALAVAQASGTKAPLTDPECLSMGKVKLGYNGQIAVDSACHLIVVAEIVDAPTDHAQLPVVGAAALEVLGQTELVAPADAGFHDRAALVESVAAGLIPCVPAPRRGNSASRGLFAKDEFTYEAARAGYRCPAGKLLGRTGQHQKHGVLVAEYSAPAACRACPFREQCHSGPYRRLERGPDADLLEEIAERVATQPHYRRLRKSLVEHPFGTIKYWRHGVLLTRGRRMVQAEWSLQALAYNVTRAMNVLGVPMLLAALRVRPAWQRAGRPGSLLAAATAALAARFGAPSTRSRLARRRGAFRGARRCFFREKSACAACARRLA